MPDRPRFPIPGLSWVRPVEPARRDARARQLVARRVAVYRKRAAAIEARFGADAQLPADVDVFRPSPEELDSRESA